MATKATSVTRTKEVTVTKMVPVTSVEIQTVTEQVSQLLLNFKSGQARQFSITAFGALIAAMQDHGVDYTIRVKASKTASPDDAKALKRINNLLIRLGKDSGVSARKDKDGTPTEACNNCTRCTEQ